MQGAKTLALGLLAGLLAPQLTMAQAVSEYGRSVQGATERQKGARAQGSASPSKNLKDKNDVPGVGDLGGKPVPSQLVVSSNEAALFPRQDEESQKIEPLTHGEILVPLLQSNGGNEWYMVKTSRGKVGWVRSADVREQAGRKQ